MQTQVNITQPDFFDSPHSCDLHMWKQFDREIKNFHIESAAKKLGMDYADIINCKNNTALFDAFIERAHHLRKNKKRYGARAIMEHLRWETNAEDDSKTFKIGNNITPRFNELSMEIFPRLNGFFSKHGR